MSFNYNGHRNSYTELDKIYFWTTTVNSWNQLLKSDENKMIIINSLQWLRNNQFIEIYGYVIMPNHIHLIWKQLKLNGKEFPKSSFEKYTARLLVKNMQVSNDTQIHKYAVREYDRKNNIWKRDPLAVSVFSKEMAAQKINYMHNNPLQAHWTLCTIPEDYRFSSARFYTHGLDEFNILTHYMDVF